MDIVILIGRILFVAVFVGAALGHFTNTAAVTAHTESMGLRPGRLFVIGSGIWQLAAAVLVALGAWADLGALMLAVFLVPTAVIMHRFWSAPDAQTKMTAQIQFNKDISLAGAALILLGCVVTAGHSLDYTLTGPLFS